MTSEVNSSLHPELFDIKPPARPLLWYCNKAALPSLACAVLGCGAAFLVARYKIKSLRTRKIAQWILLGASIGLPTLACGGGYVGQVLFFLRLRHPLRQYRVAAPLDYDRSTDPTVVEAAVADLSSQFDALGQRNPIVWIDQNFRGSVSDYCKRSLLRGTCLGQTVQLMVWMQLGAHGLSSTELLERCLPESIAAGQCLEALRNILRDNLNGPWGTAVDEEVRSQAESWRDICSDQVVANAIQTASIVAQLEVEWPFTSSQLSKEFDQSQVISGWVWVEGRSVGHAFWFQLTGGHLRVYDPISPFDGMFEFPEGRQDLFFESLRTQITRFNRFGYSANRVKGYLIQNQIAEDQA